MVHGRQICTVLTLAFLTSTGSLADDQAFDEWDQRDVWQLEFTGNETFEAGDIRNAVALDGQVQANVNPAISLEKFHAALVQRIADGYQSKGFDDVQVEVSGEGVSKPVTVRIAEGPRYRCGDVRITGWTGPDADALLRRIRLKEKKDNESNSQEKEDTADESVRWKVGKPASFAATHISALEKRAHAIMGEMGFHFAKLSVEAEKNKQTSTAELVITVHEPGPRQKISELQFEGLTRHTPADLFEVLDLPDELTATRALHQQIRNRLIATGRFVYVRTSLEPPFGPNHVLPLVVHVREFEDVPRLGEPLNPTQQAMVNLARYIRRLPETGEDLTFHLAGAGLTNQIGDAAKAVTGPKNEWPAALRPDAVDFRLTLSGSGGGMLRAVVARRDGLKLIDATVPFVAGHLGAVNHGNRTRWVCENFPFGGIITLSIAGHEPDPEGHQFTLNFAAGVSSSADEPLKTLIQANPAALINAYSKVNDLETTATQNTTVVRWAQGHMEIDNNSGALTSMRMESNGAVLTGRSGAGILDAQVAGLKQETANRDNLWSKDRALAGFVQFAAGSWQSLMESTGEPLSPLMEFALKTLKDRTLFDHIQNQFAALNAEANFSIPYEPQKNQPGITQTWGLHALKGLVPTGSAPHRLAASMLHAQASGESNALSTVLADITRNSDHGPVTCVLSGTLLPTYRAPLARIGLSRFDEHSFPPVIETILREPCVVTNLVVQVIDGVRSMSDREFEQLTTLINHVHAGAKQDEQQVPLTALLIPLHVTRNYPSDDARDIAVAFAAGIWKVWGREQTRQTLLSWLPQEESAQIFRQASQSTPIRGKGTKATEKVEHKLKPIDLPKPEESGSFFRKPTKIK